MAVNRYMQSKYRQGDFDPDRRRFVRGFLVSVAGLSAGMGTIAAIEKRYGIMDRVANALEPEGRNEDRNIEDIYPGPWKKVPFDGTSFHSLGGELQGECHELNGDRGFLSGKEPIDCIGRWDWIDIIERYNGIKHDKMQMGQIYRIPDLEKYAELLDER